MNRPLSFRTEFARQARRPRTLWSFGILLALPLIVAASFALGDPESGGGTRFSDLATSGALNFALFLLLVSAELLLLILMTLFVGDSVPSEAGWGTLRYLLTAPVARARLLTVKLLVGLATSLAAIILLIGWSLIVGGLAYGWAPLSIPLGGELSGGAALLRIALAAAYVVVSLLPFAALALWVGISGATPLGAVGAAVLAAIVSSILDALDALGDWRRALPNHYSRAWLELFAGDPDPTSLARGVAWAALYTIVLTALAYRAFARKDILS